MYSNFALKSFMNKSPTTTEKNMKIIQKILNSIIKSYKDLINDADNELLKWKKYSDHLGESNLCRIVKKRYKLDSSSLAKICEFCPLGQMKSVLALRTCHDDETYYDFRHMINFELDLIKEKSNYDTQNHHALLYYAKRRLRSMEKSAKKMNYIIK